MENQATQVKTKMTLFAGLFYWLFVVIAFAPSLGILWEAFFTNHDISLTGQTGAGFVFLFLWWLGFGTIAVKIEEMSIKRQLRILERE